MNRRMLIVNCFVIYYLLENFALAGIPLQTPSITGFRWWSTPIEYAGRLYVTVDNYNLSNRRSVLYYYDDKTNELVQVNNKGNSEANTEIVQNVSKVIKFNGRLFFWAKLQHQQGYWDRSLYSYDALSQELQAHDINLTSKDELSSVSDFKIYDNKLFFAAKLDGYNRHVWSYNPFSKQLSSIVPLTPNVTKARVDFDETFADTLSFSFLNLDAYKNHHYVYDRKTNKVIQTEVPYTINTQTLSSYNPQISYLGDIYGSCQNPNNENDDIEFCRRALKTGKVAMVTEIYQGNQSSSSPKNFIHYADALYFTASDSQSSRGLYKYDVLSNSTHLIDGFTGDNSSSYAGNILTEYNGKLYFTINHTDDKNRVSSSYLWSYDGKSATYAEIGGFAVDNTASVFLTVFNDKLYVGLSSRSVYVYDSKTQDLSPWRPKV